MHPPDTKSTYRRLRLGSLLLDGAMIAVVFLGISAWQTRNLLPVDEGTGAPAYVTIRTSIDGPGVLRFHQAGLVQV